MELRTFNRDKGPVLLAVAALLALGLGSMFLTWQNIRRQRDLVDQHIQLAGEAVVHGVEANLMRVMHSLRRSPDAPLKFFPAIRDLFKEMTASGDVVFIGVFDEDGRLIVSSSEEDERQELVLPEVIIAALEIRGHWSGPLTYKDRPAIFSAVRARPSLSLLSEGARLGLHIPPEMLFPEPPADERGKTADAASGAASNSSERNSSERTAPQDRGHGMEREHGPMMGRGGPPDRIDMRPSLPGLPLDDDDAPPRRDLHTGGRTPELPSLFLMAGMNPQSHLEQFQAYRRAAMLQAGYVFGAASLLWALAFAYLRRREQAMKAVQLERFQSKLLDNMPDGLVTLDADGTILSANGSAARLLLDQPVDGQPNGADAEPKTPEGGALLVGRNWAEFPFAAGAPQQGPGAVEPQWRQHEHAGRVLEVLCLPLQPEASSQGLAGEKLVLLRDRTRLKTLEEDLAEAKRLAAIGSLAAGVAHEIRNPLSSLRGFAQLFATKLKGQEPLCSYASTMVQEADRLNRVVTDLLFLARPRDLAPVEVDLKRLMESLSGLLRFDLEHKGVSPAMELKADSVYADEDALRQCLLNLVVNALDALPETGGALTITAQRGDDGRGAPGVWISVADNGRGMEEAVRQRAFEPFFTDKRQGTGLGLAIVQGIMRGHRGRAEIVSAPGAGATLRLFFPDAPETPDTPNTFGAPGDTATDSGPHSPEDSDYAAGGPARQGGHDDATEK